MKHQLATAFTAFLLALGLPASAQRLMGKITDAATGQPVPYASIGVLGTTRGTTSNAEGEFELREVALPGRLVVSELGHRRDTVAVAATAGASQPLQIRLAPASVQLPEVQVGSYLGELVAKAYRQLRRTNGLRTYGQTFYRQVTRLDNEATEVQEMVWDTETSNAGLEGSALAQARFAKKKALISFTNFSLYTKRYSLFSMRDDSSTFNGLIGPRVTDYMNLKLLGVTQDGGQSLVEIGFSNKQETATDFTHGSMVINEATHQVLRLRLETSGFHTKSNNPFFKFKNEVTRIEWAFKPSARGAATLAYLKVDYQTSLGRGLKSDMAIHVASLAACYNGQASPAAGVTYAPARRNAEGDLAAIKQTTYDPAFWRDNPVVKRTPVEEEIMKSFEQKGAFGTMLTP
jgi:hypothetical protein